MKTSIFCTQKTIKLSVTGLLSVMICLIACISSISPFDQPALGLTKSERIEIFKNRQKDLAVKRKQTRTKILEIKKQQTAVWQKLTATRNQLESARNSLMDEQFRLKESRKQLNNLEDNLVNIYNEQVEIKEQVGKRIRQIYKGERISLLHMILEAKDISSFLDRLYYQQRILNKDKDILNKLRAKTAKLIAVKKALQMEKENIITSINAIEARKQEIAIAVKINQDLANKLQHDRSFYESAENELASESNRIEASIQSLLAKASSTVSYATGGFIRPISGSITSNFGWRRHPIFGSMRFHTGVDISAPNRTPIRAANSGKIIYTGWRGGYGNVVIIDHGKSITTLYAHMSSFAVSSGQNVSKGQVIGYEGSTGYSTGPHLHFEVRRNGKPINPLGHF